MLNIQCLSRQVVSVWIWLANRLGGEFFVERSHAEALTDQLLTSMDEVMAHTSCAQILIMVSLLDTCRAGLC